MATSPGAAEEEGDGSEEPSAHQPIMKAHLFGSRGPSYGPIVSPFPPVPEPWAAALLDVTSCPELATLAAFLEQDRCTFDVFPPVHQIFRALELTPPTNVRAVILGQDPYHGEHQAHGLSFSVPPGVKIPPSLRNIHRELLDDVGVSPPSHGCLDAWAVRGVLLLNAVLTVRAHQPNSHRNKGWELFTDGVLRAVNAGPASVAFVLWGNHAQKKELLIDTTKHAVIESAHPSPLSAHQGFFGSRPFSKVNAHLIANGQEPIDWRLD